MLTAEPDLDIPGAGLRHRGVLLALVRATLRVSVPARTIALLGLGALPVALTVVRGGSDVGTSLVALALVSGASMGSVADDPVAELVAPCPIGGSARLAVRGVMEGCAVAATVGVALVAVALGPGLPAGSVDRSAALAMAAAGVALAVGLAARRRGEPYGSLGGIAAGVLVPLSIGALAFRWPTHLPDLGGGPNSDRWWWLVVAGFAAACVAGRDPARRSLLYRTTGADP